MMNLDKIKIDKVFEKKKYNRPGISTKEMKEFLDNLEVEIRNDKIETILSKK